MKDWTGNSKSVYSVLGASSHSNTERQSEDYYATPSIAVEKLLEKEKFSFFILEPCCGEGHISKILKEHGYSVWSSDLIDRGYGDEFGDFLVMNDSNARDIITNPPYALAYDFVEHALDISEDDVKVAMLLKIQFLEGKKRRKLFEKYPPRTCVCVF